MNEDSSTKTAAIYFSIFLIESPKMITSLKSLKGNENEARLHLC